MFRAVIADAIKKNKVSYRKLGDASGVSFSLIAAYVRGDHDITTDKLFALLCALNLKVKVTKVKAKRYANHPPSS